MARAVTWLQLRKTRFEAPTMSLMQLFTATDAAPYAWSLVLSGGYVVASILPLGAARQGYCEAAAATHKYGRRGPIGRDGERMTRGAGRLSSRTKTHS